MTQGFAMMHAVRAACRAGQITEDVAQHLVLVLAERINCVLGSLALPLAAPTTASTRSHAPCTPSVLARVQKILGMQPVVTEQAQDVSCSQAPSGPHFPRMPFGPHIFEQAASSTTAAPPVQKPDSTVADCDVQARVPLAAQASTGNVAPPRSPSHQDQPAQSNRKLVCCLACEGKRLAKRNPDIIMGVSEAQLAQGIETTRACPDFDFLSIYVSVFC